MAPFGLLNVDPFSIRKSAPDQVAVPVLVTVRVSRNGSPVIVIPPLAVVDPVPLSVPPDHVTSPVTVSASLPVSVPALCVRVVVVTALPVERFNVPEVIVIAPKLVAGMVKFAVPPVAVVLPVTLYVPV